MDTTRFGNVPVPPPTPGVVLQSHDYDTPCKTVVVVGVRRGGTSAIAAVIAGLGIDMGVNYGTCEDAGLLPALRNQQDSLPTLISQRNDLNQVWGFKCPELIECQQPRELHQQLRNPYYVIILRDPVAIAQTRLNMHDSQGVADAWTRAIKDQLQLATFLRILPHAPKLLVSYQRLLQQPERLCSNLADFFGLTFSPQQIRQAVARVSPDGGYLRVPDPLREQP